MGYGHPQWEVVEDYPFSRENKPCFHHGTYHLSLVNSDILAFGVQMVRSSRDGWDGWDGWDGFTTAMTDPRGGQKVSGQI